MQCKSDPLVYNPLLKIKDEGRTGTRGGGENFVLTKRTEEDEKKKGASGAGGGGGDLRPITPACTKRSRGKEGKGQTL